VEPANAFIGKTQPPTEADIATALGRSATAWSDFIAGMIRNHNVSEQEWKSSSPKYGWSLRLKVRGRTIVYLAPCGGCFCASFVLGPRAIEAAHLASLPKAVLEAIDNAPRYAEGTGVRLFVKSAADLDPIRELARIKLAS